MRRFLSLFLLCLSLMTLLGCHNLYTRSDDGTPPHISLDGHAFWLTELYANTLPAGWEEAGTAESGVYKDHPYYTHPDRPYWLYVKDEDTHKLLVDTRIWKEKLICWEDHLYGQLESTHHSSGLNNWVPRSEIDNLIPLGIAEHTGLYTVPTGELSSNFFGGTVYRSSDYPDILFIPSTGNSNVGGYTVFVSWIMPE